MGLMLMALASSDNICHLKLGRVTQQSVAMLRNLKKFFNIEFKIDECQDEVYEDSSDNEEEKEEDKNSEQGEDE